MSSKRVALFSIGGLFLFVSFFAKGFGSWMFFLIAFIAFIVGIASK